MTEHTPEAELEKTATEVAADLLDMLKQEAIEATVDDGVLSLRIDIDQDGWVEVVTVALEGFAGRASMVETVTTEQFVIEGQLYADGILPRPLPRLIGPFPSRDAAASWVESQLPLYGEWNVSPLFRPSPEEGKG